MKRIYFGIGQGLDRNNQPLSNVLSLRRQAYVRVAETFGGFHASLGQGGWISPINGLMLEDSLGITVYTDQTEHVASIARYLGELFSQESILVSIAAVESLDFVEVLAIAS